jgi:hypothetical protein
LDGWLWSRRIGFGAVRIRVSVFALSGSRLLIPALLALVTLFPLRLGAAQLGFALIGCAAGAFGRTLALLGFGLRARRWRRFRGEG